MYHLYSPWKSRVAGVLPTRFGLVSGRLCTTTPWKSRVAGVRSTVSGKLCTCHTSPAWESRVGGVRPTPFWFSLEYVVCHPSFPWEARVGGVRTTYPAMGLFSGRLCPTRLWETGVGLILPPPSSPTPTHPPYLFRDSRVGRVLPTPSWKNFGRVMSPTYACVGHIRVDRVLTYFEVLSVRWCPTRLWNTLG